MSHTMISETCSICLEESSMLITVKPCNHMFHIKCLRNLIKAECPNCRTDLSEFFKCNDITLGRIHRTPTLNPNLSFELLRNFARDSLRNLARDPLRDPLQEGRFIPHAMLRDRIPYNDLIALNLLREDPIHRLRRHHY